MVSVDDPWRAAARAQVGEERARDAPRVHPEVLPEVRVFHRDGRVAQDGGDVLEPDHHPPLDRELAEQLAVGGVDLRDDVRLEVLERRDLGQVLLVGEEDPGQRAHEDRDHEEQGDAGPAQHHAQRAHANAARAARRGRRGHAATIAAWPPRLLVGSLARMARRRRWWGRRLAAGLGLPAAPDRRAEAPRAAGEPGVGSLREARPHAGSPPSGAPRRLRDGPRPRRRSARAPALVLPAAARPAAIAGLTFVPRLAFASLAALAPERAEHGTEHFAVGLGGLVARARTIGGARLDVRPAAAARNAQAFRRLLPSALPAAHVGGMRAPRRGRRERSRTPSGTRRSATPRRWGRWRRRRAQCRRDPRSPSMDRPTAPHDRDRGHRVGPHLGHGVGDARTRQTCCAAPHAPPPPAARPRPRDRGSGAPVRTRGPSPAAPKNRRAGRAGATGRGRRRPRGGDRSTETGRPSSRRVGRQTRRRGRVRGGHRRARADRDIPADTSRRSRHRPPRRPRPETTSRPGSSTSRGTARWPHRPKWETAQPHDS